MLGKDAFSGCSSLSNIYIDMDSSTFYDRFSSGYQDKEDIGSLVSAMFGDVRDDNECHLVFNDITYTNNGIVKIDNEFICTYDGNASRVSALNYKEFNKANQQYLNLSAISCID